MREQRQQTSQILIALILSCIYCTCTFIARIVFYIGIYTIKIILLYLEYSYNAVVAMQYVTKMEEPFFLYMYIKIHTTA